MIKSSKHGAQMPSDPVAFAVANALPVECAHLGSEGIVAKRMDPQYRSGPRRRWIKIRTAERNLAVSREAFRKLTRG
jgi:ATP-dependent DNA ligase